MGAGAARSPRCPPRCGGRSLCCRGGVYSTGHTDSRDRAGPRCSPTLPHRARVHPSCSSKPHSRAHQNWCPNYEQYFCACKSAPGPVGSTYPSPENSEGLLQDTLRPAPPCTCQLIPGSAHQLWGLGLRPRRALRLPAHAGSGAGLRAGAGFGPWGCSARGAGLHERDVLAEQLREVVEVGVLQRGLGRHAPRGLVAQHLRQQVRPLRLQAGHHLPRFALSSQTMNIAIRDTHAPQVRKRLNRLLIAASTQQRKW